MNIALEIDENGSIAAHAERKLSPGESETSAFASLLAELDVDRTAVLKELGVNDTDTDIRNLFGAETNGQRLKIHRVCVDLHFESEHETHKFLSRQTWGDVHKFGCKKFSVPSDACANLELRDGSPTGPALNDRSELGEFKGCREVWMVKPGPEPNGGIDGAL